MTQPLMRTRATLFRTRATPAMAGDAAWEPLARQAVVSALILIAAVSSAALPWLLVTDATRMWQGVAIAAGLVVVGGVMALWPASRRAELVLPLGDFVAIGLLRFGTGDSQSVFLAIIVLPVIWIAAGSERWRVILPLGGVCATLLLPLVLVPGRGVTPSEIVRLLIAVLVYTATAAVVNELSRRSLRRLSQSQRYRRIAENELTEAAVVQRSLQPADGSDLPPAFRVVGACAPARAVGGDFYDWYPTVDGGAAFILGDVMGKGVGAGMIAAAVRTVIRSGVHDGDPAVAIDRAAIGMSPGTTETTDVQFTTCFHARIDADGELRWADAGHGLTILRRVGGTRNFLRSGGLPIGIGNRWSSSSTMLEPGDTLISVSDGVLDLFGGSLDSIDRYVDFLDRHDDIGDIVDELIALAEADEQEDDVTVLAVTWVGGRPTLMQ